MENRFLPFSFETNRPFDIACLGRLAVDLYGQTQGVGLEKTPAFSKYLGGSSANIALGTARLGLKSAMISRVGDEQMGQYLVDTLAFEGCDTSQIIKDKERLTGLVFLALKDQERFPLLFYRRDCADMAICEDDIKEDFIKDCKALLITGTHLSQETVLKASRKALYLAKKHNTKTILDIDYRPVLWGLTSTGDGETRYIASNEVSQHLQNQLPLFDLIIGTEEEFMIAGGVENDLIASLKAVRNITKAVLVLKIGALGCQILDENIPDNLDSLPIFKGEQVEVLNVLGAGDAFASGLIYGLMIGKNYQESAKIANICGAIVVSRHACSAEMPTPIELAYWLEKSSNGETRPDLDEQLQHLHRVTCPRPNWQELCVLAFDHRSQFEELVIKQGKSTKKIDELKTLVFNALEEVEIEHPNLQGKLGILADNTYAKQVLANASERTPAWWVGRPVELPGSRPLSFDRTDSLGSTLSAIPLQQTIKCLVFYHPDDNIEMRLEQEKRLLELYEAVRKSGHELLLEIIYPPEIAENTLNNVDKDNDSAILRTICRLYNIGIKPQWWKLADLRKQNWDELAKIIERYDPFCRGVVLLGLNQTEEALIAQFKNANNSIVKGFMIGRTVWQKPLEDYLSGTINSQNAKNQIKNNFIRLAQAWLNRKS